MESVMKKMWSAFFILLWVCPLILWAQTIGSVEFILGKAEISRDGRTLHRVDIGTAIENLDTVMTGPDCQLVIAFAPSSGISGSIALESGTRLVVRQEQLASGKNNDFQLVTGSVGVKVKRLAGTKSGVQVRSPTAILGVRGTEFNVISFNGSALIGCKEGEVFCAPYSELTAQRAALDSGRSSIPGRLIEILESGSVREAQFPEGEYDEQWENIAQNWKGFHVSLIVNNPVSFLDQFVPQWNQYSSRLDSAAKRLSSNPVLAKWFEEAKKGKVSDSYADFVKDGPRVMSDMIAVRPDMVMSIMVWYRLEELVPLVPQSEMNQKLSSGQTVRAFIDSYRRSSDSVREAASLFTAAEKQYMLRSGGMSPFAGFN